MQLRTLKIALVMLALALSCVASVALAQVPVDPFRGSTIPAAPGWNPGPSQIPSNSPPFPTRPPAARPPVGPRTSQLPPRVPSAPPTLQLAPAQNSFTTINSPATVASQGQPIEAAQILAWVGDEFIQKGEVLGTVDQIMKANQDKIPPGDWDKQRKILMQQALKRVIESKLILVDAKRTLPPEALPKIRAQVNKQFDKEFIKVLMKNTKVESRAELEAKLLESGSSLDAQRRTYFERSLSTHHLQNKVKDDSPIPYNEIYDDYIDRLADYEHPTKARWEQLTATFSNHPTKRDALTAIIAMGNEVILSQNTFAGVAKSKSDGLTASEGGKQDWTSKGALKSKLLDEAIFTLPVGKLSTILEDKDAYHIIRVVERKPAYRTAFRDAQVEIEKKLKETRRKAKIEEYYASLRKDIRVWTIFDDTATANRTSQF